MRGILASRPSSTVLSWARAIVAGVIAMSSLMWTATPAEAAVSGAVAGDRFGRLEGRTSDVDPFTNVVLTEFSDAYVRRGDPVDFAFTTTHTTDMSGVCPPTDVTSPGTFSSSWPLFRVTAEENGLSEFLDPTNADFHNRGATGTTTTRQQVMANCVSIDTVHYELTFAGDQTATLPCGMFQTVPTNPANYFHPDHSSGDLATFVIADEECPGSVTVRKYHDADHDGAVDDGEPLLSGWSFFVDANGNSTRDSGEAQGTTDSTGSFTFIGLTAGTAHRICEEVTDGWVNTDPGGNVRPCETAVIGEDALTLDFGNASVASTGARTIGYWRNKNGQANIRAYCRGADGAPGTADDLVGRLRALNPFADLSTDATCAQAADYATNTINAATKRRINEPSNANTMLKAQLLATALNAYFSDPTAGGNRIHASGPIGTVLVDLKHVCAMWDEANGSANCAGIEDASAAFNGQAAMIVSNMLTWAATQATQATTANPLASPWYGQNRNLQRLAKDSFDAVNNEVSL